MDEKTRAAARERKRAQRARDRQRIYDQAAQARDDDPADPSSDQIAPAGVLPPPLSGGPAVADLMTEQAIWVQRRRQITELELSRRRGELISAEDAARQAAALARRVRAALDRAPSLLPADLSPENHAVCKAAMASAIRSALALME